MALGFLMCATTCSLYGHDHYGARDMCACVSLSLTIKITNEDVTQKKKTTEMCLFKWKSNYTLNIHHHTQRDREHFAKAGGGCNKNRFLCHIKKKWALFLGKSTWSHLCRMSYKMKMFRTEFYENHFSLFLVCVCLFCSSLTRFSCYFELFDSTLIKIIRKWVVFALDIIEECYSKATPDVSVHPLKNSSS